MRFRNLLAVLAAAAVVLACPSPEERAENAREAARQALRRGDRFGAVKALEELREVQPDTPEALLELATLLLAAGEAPQVVWLLQAGVQRFPERDELRVALGQVNLMIADAAGARAAVESIAPDSDAHPSALVVLGRAELRLGNLERALEILKDAERRYPERPEARIARIGTLLVERRFEEAHTALDEAREALESVESRAHLRRLTSTYYSLLGRQEGQTQAAVEGLRQLVDEDPDDPQAWQFLVQLLSRTGKVEEALELVKAALETDPDRFVLYSLVAPLHAALGDEEAAEGALREFVDRSGSPTAYVRLAEFYAERRDEEQVLEVYALALGVFPDHGMLRRSYAETLVWFGRLEAARAELEQFQEQFPDDPNVEYLRARLELAEGDAEAAVKRLRRMMPRLDAAATQFWLGRALEATGDTRGAERRYVLALIRNPSDPTLYPPLIHLAEQRGDWRAVAGAAEMLTRRAPGLFEGWATLISALVNLGEGGRAERVASRCAELFPDRAEAHLQLARALRVQGKYDAALEQLEQVRARFGSSPALDAERVLTLGIAGRVQEGVEGARAALEQSPDSAALHVGLAALLFQAGQAEEGARAVDRALELDPDDPTPLRIRCEFRAATARLEGARSDCERYLALRPDDPTVHFMLGVVHASASRPDEAIAAYRRAAELDDRAFAPRNNLAELLADRGDLDGALAAAQEAYAIASDDSYVMDTLGWLYLKKGLVERAVSLLEEAHGAAPGRFDPQLHLALAYRDAGRSDDARRLLTDLSERANGSPEARARVDEALHSLE